MDDMEKLIALRSKYDKYFTGLLQAWEIGNELMCVYFRHHENKLNNEINALKQKMGLLAKDPCPYPSSAWDCRVCDKCNLTMKKGV